jgi:MoaA/NifB/PqqE/SkfB family radical SAM enzyme
VNLGGPYSPFKIVHHADRIAALKAGEHPAPVHVQLIISDFCNQDCSFCAYRTSGYTTNQMFGEDGNNNPKRFIPTEKVREILDDCRDMGVKAIQLTGGGEPTAHPDFADILEMIHARGLDLSLVTNGVALKDSHIHLLERAKWVRVSIDAGTAHTYAAIRRVPESMFFKAWGNIGRLVRLNGPIVGVGFVVTRDNWNEVVEAAYHAKDVGAHNFRISAAFLPDNAAYHRPHHKEAAALAATAARMSTDGFRVFNLYGDRLEDLEQEAPDYDTCVYQRVTTYIGGDLNLYRCCNTSYNAAGLIGTLKDKSFAAAWREAQARLENFDPRACERCQFNRPNRLANYMIEKEPEHANFV